MISLQRLTTSGTPVRSGSVVVTPQAQAVVLRLPFGGFVWNRPVGIQIEQGGRVERRPIVDVTRVVQVALLGGMVAAALAGLVSRRLSNGRVTE